MDYDLMRAVEEAWERVEPLVERDAGELERRLARRRLGMMTRRWPRAWCVGVRACDTRITGMRFVLTPSRPEWWDEGAHAWRRVEHEVVLEAAQLRWLCRPVTIPAPGVEWTELAELLGVNKRSVYAAVKRGELSVRYIKGLGGKRALPVPLVYTRRELDPAGIPLGRMSDEAWGITWRYVADHVPEGFRQELVRRPVYGPAGKDLVFRGWRWVCPRCAGEVTRVYLPVRGLVLARFVDEEKVRGLRIPPLRIEDCGMRNGDEDGGPSDCGLGIDFDELSRVADCGLGEGGSGGASPSQVGFACGRCHGVHDYGRLGANGWDELVAHLTGGLLYGHEVKRPEWWVVERKREYRKRPGYPKSKRRPQIEAMLVNTELSCAAIAKKLGLAPGTVQGWVGRIYRERGVRGRHELRQVLGERMDQGVAVAG